MLLHSRIGILVDTNQGELINRRRKVCSLNIEKESCYLDEQAMMLYVEACGEALRMHAVALWICGSVALSCPSDIFNSPGTSDKLIQPNRTRARHSTRHTRHIPLF